MDASPNSSLNVSVSSISTSALFTSTPKKSRSRSLFKKPIARKKEVAACTICTKKYKCLRSFNSHMRVHAIKDAAHRFPNSSALLANQNNFDSAVLNHMAVAPAFGTSGKTFQELVQCFQANSGEENYQTFTRIICNKFANSVKNSKFLLPSSLLSVIICTLEEMLSNLEERQVLLNHLTLVTKDYSEAMLQSFTFLYVSRFAKEFLHFISTSMIGTHIQQNHVEYILNSEERQVVHYISGSTLKGFLRMAHRYPKNEDWKAISNVIDLRLLEGGIGVTEVSEKDKHWTLVMCRGKLKKVSACCFEFFISVSQHLFKVQAEIGEIRYDAVLESVYNSNTLGLWDCMIAGYLNENLSLKFVNGVVKSFSQTFGSGLVKQKTNEKKQKGTTSVPLRHIVAPRK